MVIKEDDEDRDLDRTKPLKVSVPIKQHIDLHKLKILTGKNMSETVQDALEMYLDAIRENGGVLEESADGPEEGA